LSPEPPSLESSHGIELLLDVALEVSVELGRSHMAIGDILALRTGSVIELDKLAGEPVDVSVNGTLIARGEVVVVDEKFGVRITEVVSRARRIASIA
jgi:flagellar motor switch protein FliN/FliY